MKIYQQNKKKVIYCDTFHALEKERMDKNKTIIKLLFAKYHVKINVCMSSALLLYLKCLLFMQNSINMRR